VVANLKYSLIPKILLNVYSSFIIFYFIILYLYFYITLYFIILYYQSILFRPASGAADYQSSVRSALDF